jgi:Protein of unknown function (DUF429)
MAAEQTDMVAGIDVGGTKKGFHLVVLQGSAVTFVASSLDVRELHERCLQFKVSVVGIDAPSQWGVEGIGRAAEKWRGNAFRASRPRRWRVRTRALAAFTSGCSTAHVSMRCLPTFIPS